MTTLDLLTDPKLLAKAKTYFRDVQNKDQHYEPISVRTGPPAGDDERRSHAPATCQNWKKFYYDPAKYPTYLDQLGVKWPTPGQACRPVAAKTLGEILRAS